MKVMVTGGFGFIGSHVIEKLLEKGHEVRVLARRRAVLPEIGNNVEMKWGDIRDLDSCKEACSGMDAVIHTAAMSSIPECQREPLEMTRINVKGTRNVLQACAENGVRRFLFPSSAKIYGEEGDLPSREDAIPNPQIPYALSKLVGEYYCWLYHERFGIETVVLRYFSVYGPRQNLENGYIGAIVKALGGDGRLMLHGDENIERDFTFVSDAADAALLALEKEGLKKEVFNIGSGKARSLREVLDIANKISPGVLQVRFGALLSGMDKKTQADISRAERILDYHPRVGLAEGLERTAAWHAARKGGHEE